MCPSHFCRVRVTSLSSQSHLKIFRVELLRSEIPSGMCAQLRTVAESNNRDHAPQPLYYWLFALHIFFSSRTSRSWWITQSTQHHRRGRNSILLLWPLPVVIAKLRFVTISTIMCLSAGPTRGGYKRYIVPCSGRYWEDENTHAMCFCNKAQNYLCVPVASMPIDLFLYLGMVAVLSTF